MAENTERARLLVEELTKLLVDSPGQVSVTPVDEDGETVLELRVAPEDVGKIIGRQGRTARSLRTIVHAATMNLPDRYSLEIIE
ncbi:MAG: KH domain-containing protein [Acidobacteria bacterium]|nr:KH domain-containing protein [Acidobacteriota bacterium]